MSNNQIEDMLPVADDKGEAASAEPSAGADQSGSSEMKKPPKPVVRRDRLIIILLIVFVLKGLIYATVIPLWTAPDEPGHFQSAERKATLLYSGFKPSSFYGGDHVIYAGTPASYYWLTGLALLPMSESDAGTRALALRVLSILLNTGAIYFTYRMARELFPEERLVYLSAPMAMGMLPMFAFTGMSINSDNLAIVIFCLFLWLAIRLIVRGFDFPTAIMAIVAVIAGLLTKRTTATAGILLVLLPFFAVFREAAKTRTQRLLRILPVLLIPIVFLAMFPLISWLATALANENNLYESVRVALRSDIQQLFLTPSRSLISSFWAHFGWMDIPRSGGYGDLQKVWYLPLAGYLIMLFSYLLYKRTVINRVQLVGLVFLSASVAGAVFIALVFPAAKSVSIEAWSPQARYIWPILGGGAMVFVVGIVKGVPALSWLLEHLGYSDNINLIRGRLALGAFLLLALAIFYFDFSVMREMIIPRYYADFGLGAVVIKDSLVTDHPSMHDVFARLAMTQSEIQRELLWRPRLLSVGAVYFALFAGYLLGLFSFLASVAREEMRKT